jgi:hypothetical protein
VSTGTHSYAIFGDMNQQGSLTTCTSSQDARGGLFFVVDNAQLHDSVRDLIQGDSAPIDWNTEPAGEGGHEPLVARQALGEIIKQAALPVCLDTDQLRSSKDEDGMYLYQKLDGAGWEKVGSDYLQSLNDLAEGLIRLGTAPRTEKSCAMLRLIVKDLHTKRADCAAMGHSRTDIPVEISTTQGKDPVPRLEVYFRWLPAGDHFTTVPKRLRDLSSPARGTVPIPGEFEIFARDPATGKSTTPERVSIGGSATFKWPLPVSFAEGSLPNK